MHFCSMFWCISEGKKSPKAKPSSKALFGKVCRNLRKLERRNENPGGQSKETIHKLKTEGLDTQNVDGLQMIFLEPNRPNRQFQGTIPFLFSTQWPSVMAVKSLRCRGASIGKLRASEPVKPRLFSTPRNLWCHL